MKLVQYFRPEYDYDQISSIDIEDLINPYTGSALGSILGSSLRSVMISISLYRVSYYSYVDKQRSYRIALFNFLTLLLAFL